MLRGTARLTLHELRALQSLCLWAARHRHGVRPGDHAAGDTGPQSAMLYGLLFVAVVETVVLAVVIPWPLVHAVLLCVDVYTCVPLLGLQAGCVTRPHMVGADGSLRIRYGALFDLRLRPEDIVRVTAERRFPTGRQIQLDEDGVLDVMVGAQTTVRVEPAAPVLVVRPLGRRVWARAVRCHADDPAALVATVAAARAST